MGGNDFLLIARNDDFFFVVVFGWEWVVYLLGMVFGEG